MWREEASEVSGVRGRARDRASDRSVDSRVVSDSARTTRSPRGRTVLVAQLRRERVEAILPPRGDDEPASELREPLRGRESDPGRRAGDERASTRDGRGLVQLRDHRRGRDAGGGGVGGHDARDRGDERRRRASARGGERGERRGVAEEASRERSCANERGHGVRAASRAVAGKTAARGRRARGRRLSAPASCDRSSATIDRPRAPFADARRQKTRASLVTPTTREGAIVAPGSMAPPAARVRRRVRAVRGGARRGPGRRGGYLVSRRARGDDRRPAGGMATRGRGRGRRVAAAARANSRDERRRFDQRRHAEEDVAPSLLLLVDAVGARSATSPRRRTFDGTPAPRRTRASTRSIAISRTAAATTSRSPASRRTAPGRRTRSRDASSSARSCARRRR